MYTSTSIKNAFNYKPPKDDQPERYKKINDALLAAAEILYTETPGCDEQTEAINCLRSARMWANAAIACNK